MKKIALGGEKGLGKYMLIDDEDYHLVSSFSWHLRPDGYASARVHGSYPKGKSILAHKLIMPESSDHQVDHINGNGIDNQKSNLRLVTHQQNQWNQKKTSGSSKYKGICWDNERQKWLTQIGFNNKNIYIGRFETEHHAAMAYDISAKELFGEFSSLNFNHV